ncbi:hypothetical protein [Paenibacillus marinisediminis]
MEKQPDIEKQLRELHLKIPVNGKLKAELRNEWVQGMERDEQGEAQTARARWTRSRMWRYGLSAAMLVLVTAAVVLWTSSEVATQRVFAADLKVTPVFDTIQQLGLDPASSAVAAGDVLYVSVPQEGIYKQEGLSVELIVPGVDINSLTTSPNGKELAYVKAGGLYVYNLVEREERQIGASRDYIGELAWSPSNSRLLAVRGRSVSANADVVTHEIWEIDAASGEERFLVEGSHPAYKGNADSILYEREGSIYAWDVKSEQSTFFTEGTQPVVSSDGKYVLYVLEEGDLRMQNLWVADIDLQTRQRLSSNFSLPVSNDWSWDDVDQFADEPQRPYFTVENVTWSADGKDIIYFQAAYADPSRRQMVHLTLGDHKPTPQDTVSHMAEALIYRDEALAHQYFSFNPGYMKGTSPRQVDYRIHKVEMETNGRAVIEADMMYSYQYPYYRVASKRFVLSRDPDRGYLIDEMEEISSIAMSPWDEGDIYIDEDGKKGSLVLALNDVPVDEGWSNKEFTQLLYDTSDQGEALWFMIKQEVTAGERLRLMKADLKQGTFEAYGWIDGALHSNVLYRDSVSGYAAAVVQLADGSDDIVLISTTDANAPILTMREMLQGEQPSELTIRLFKEGKLIFAGVVGERDVFYTYNVAEQSGK